MFKDDDSYFVVIQDLDHTILFQRCNNVADVVITLSTLKQRCISTSKRRCVITGYNTINSRQSGHWKQPASHLNCDV